ncbi:MAG: hypothetical protein IJX92_00370 [Clostridia bacterium]|nr:hypothetical protein [Clostridia bacterium]
MEYKYAVAVLRYGEEEIMGLFDTKEDADEYGRSHIVPRERGLQFCYSSLFTRTGKQRGDIKMYDYYNFTCQA